LGSVRTFANTKRVKGKPFSMRVGDDKLERSENGSVCKAFGWYSPNQILSRKLWSQTISREYQGTSILKGAR
jgi:hypothetical protein